MNKIFTHKLWYVIIGIATIIITLKMFKIPVQQTEIKPKISNTNLACEEIQENGGPPSEAVKLCCKTYLTISNPKDCRTRAKLFSDIFPKEDFQHCLDATWTIPDEDIPTNFKDSIFEVIKCYREQKLTSDDELKRATQLALTLHPWWVEAGPIAYDSHIEIRSDIEEFTPSPNGCNSKNAYISKIQSISSAGPDILSSVVYSENTFIDGGLFSDNSRHDSIFNFINLYKNDSLWKGKQEMLDGYLLISDWKKDTDLYLVPFRVDDCYYLKGAYQNLKTANHPTLEEVKKIFEEK